MAGTVVMSAAPQIPAVQKADIPADAIGDGDAPPPWDIPGDDLPPIPQDAAVPPPVEEISAPAEPPQSPPTEKPQKKTAAPKKATAKPQSDPTPTPSEKKVLHGLRGWQEAVRRVERSNPIIGSFLREYKVYTCEQDGKLYLRAANAFSVKLVTTSDDNVTQICAAVNAVLGEPKYTPADLIFDSAEKRITDGYEMIDDLIESAGDVAETAE